MLFARLIQDIKSWQLLYVLFLSPQIVTFLDFPLYYPILLSLILSFSLIIYKRGSITITKNFVVLSILYGLFILFASFSIMWSPSIEQSLDVLVRLTTICVILYVVPAFLTETKDDLHRLLRVIVYGSVIVGVISIAGYFSPEYDRPFQIVGRSSHIVPGRIIGLGIPISLFYLFHVTNKYHKFIAQLSTGILTVAIVTSGSRGPLIAAILSGSVVFGYFFAKRAVLTMDRKYILYAIGGLITSILFLSNYTFPTLRRIIPILQGDLDGSAEARFDFYITAIHMWRDSPLLGRGLAGFHAEVGTYPHNIFLEVLSGLGLIGISIFILMNLYVVNVIVSKVVKDEVAVLLLGIFVYGIVNASISFNMPGQRMLFFIFGLTVSTALYK